MSKPLIHKVDLEELGDTIEPIRDGIRKLFEDAYVDTFLFQRKMLTSFTKEQRNKKNEKRFIHISKS